MRVYRSDTGQEVGRDTDYGGGSYGAHFSADNRLVASSYDGYLRLYQVSNSGLKLLAKQAAPGGKQPFAVRFSPDGRRIAVGFNDSTQVNVLDGESLNFLYAPDTAGVNNGDLSTVAWGDYGRELFAGGTFDQNGQSPIVHWRDGGRGAREFWAVGAGNTLMDFATLADGSLLFGSQDPAWGQVDGTGRGLRLVRGAIADYRAIQQGFTVSRDGQGVGFGFEYGSKQPASFDLASGLTPGPAPGYLAAPRLQAPSLDIQNWYNTTAPTLNGSPLKLEQYEISRSLAIAPDGAHFALGTEWSVYYFNTQGQQQWQVPVPGVAWAVNVSGDGRHVVAAFGDGTIRWYDARNGQEKLAFFPHADKKRWVVWTPSGYYNASPGGDELIGWHLNRGKDSAADFFPASRFRNQFYRPDVIAKALSAENEAEALRQANDEAGRKTTAPVAVQNILPPVVEIAGSSELESSQTTVTIRYRTRSPADAPVTAVRARVNGQASSNERALKLAKGDTQEISVTIPAQDSEIQLFAENKNGISVPAVVRVKWAGKAASAEENLFKPKLYVLAVGVSKYKNPDYNLGLAAKDATDFAAVLQKQKGKLYADVVVKLLTDANATRDEVVDGLDWLKQQVTSRDVGMMFVAGHGLNDNQGNYYFLPHNADPDKLLRTGVAQGDIRSTLNSLAGKAVFFVDTCHAGNALGTSKTRAIGGSTDAFINELASAENGVVVFSSSTGKQLSQENPAWGNGAFTKAVVEGLGGKADFAKNGKITHKGLDYYVTERVKELTKGQQSPVSISPSGVTDFPIAIAGGGK